MLDIVSAQNQIAQRSTRVRSVSHPPNPRDPWPCHSSNFPLPAADHHGCHRSTRVRSVFHPPNPRDPWPPVQATSHCRPRIITDVTDQHGSDPCLIRQIRAIRGPPFKQLPIAGRGSSRMPPISTGQIRVPSVESARSVAPRSSNFPLPAADHHGCHRSTRVRSVSHPPNPRDPWPPVQATSHCRPRIITDVPDQHGSDLCLIRQIRAIRGPPFKQLPIAGRGSSRMSPINTGQIRVSSAKSARSVAPRSSNFPLPAADHHGCHRSARVRSVFHPPNPRDPWPCHSIGLSTAGRGSSRMSPISTGQIRVPSVESARSVALPFNRTFHCRPRIITDVPDQHGSDPCLHPPNPRDPWPCHSSNFPLPAADHHGCPRSARVRSVSHPPNPRDPWPCH
jgi:hypothetical protein